jgi:dipeptidyl aminopeptidase/acylaminoacyl peptidase
MPRDQLELQLAELLKADLPGLRPGWEARALAALGGIRPRRHPNLVTVVVVILILLLLAAAAFAARRFLVKGTLRSVDVISRADLSWDTSKAQSFQGEGGSHRPEALLMTADLSPDGSQLAFIQDLPWPPPDILLAKPDGSGQVNLTKLAGVGGVNCWPRWSPDGRMIAFTHSDPAEGQLPCTAGFHAWVMNRDGSQAHRIMPEGFPPTDAPVWTHDGSHLLLGVSDRFGSSQAGRGYTLHQALLADLQGKEARPIPNVGGEAAYSPDCSRIVSVVWLPAVREGRPGGLNRLVLTKADGSDPRVLVEQFVADADITKRYPTPQQRAMTGSAQLDLIADIRLRLGPRTPVWSPDGNAIAFLAALNYDPDGIFYLHQIEVYVYDLTTDTLVRMTNDQVGHFELSWRK